MKNGIKRSERMEDCSQYKYIGSISPLKFEAGTIPPDIDTTKLHSQQPAVKVAKSPKPTVTSLLLILAFSSQHTMVHGSTNKIRKTDEEATLWGGCLR